MFVIQHTSREPNFILIVLRIKKNKHKCDFNYVVMPMITDFEICEFHKNIEI